MPLKFSEHDYELDEKIARDKLRDQFAMAALTGFVSNPDYEKYNPKHAASWAYSYADAMLVERVKNESRTIKRNTYNPG